MFGFVHIVGGDENADTLCDELVEQIPKGTPRDRVNARSGFVEEEQFGTMQDGSTECQPLPPTARKVFCFGVFAPFQPGHDERILNTFFQRLTIKPISRAIKLQILLDAEIVVETKALGHVADALLEFGLVAIYRHSERLNIARARR